MKGFLKRIKSKLIIKSDLLILISSIYFGIFLNLAFWRGVISKIEITNFAMILFAISLPILICSIFYLIFNLLVVKHLAKPILILFLITSSATNYLMFNLGVFIDSDMIRNLFETNVREAGDLITLSSIIWTFVGGIIPSIILIFTKIEFYNAKKESFRRMIFVLINILIIAFFAATTFKEYASFGRNNRYLRKILNTVNYTYSTFRYFQRERLAKRPFMKLDQNAILKPYADDTKTVLIIAIGEAARAMNFSLDGYERDTNPLLEKQDIVYFKDATSCGTSTAVSVPCLFSHLGKNDFDVNSAKYEENLVDILQRVGYDIVWKENDDGCKGVCSRIPTEDMVQTKNPKYCFGDYCHDEVFLDNIRDTLKNIKKDTVIILHTMGSHGPTYFNRYTDKFKKFTPTCDTSNIQNCSRESIVNTYDNTVLYTDYILSSMIDILKEFPQYESGFIYLSDHGESLGENNIYLHGLPYKFAPKEQIQIPMLIWMNDSMKKNDFIDYDCLKEQAKSGEFGQDNIFHSVISLLEINTNLYNSNLDIFKNCRIKQLPTE
ncbi:MAG: phosphoethanolamine--lipid A transferase [Rickettsiales bacterium]|nr:phosphoethanolamine--lipid A transferase [Rickettsiales bacterium]